MPGIFGGPVHCDTQHTYIDNITIVQFNQLYIYLHAWSTNGPAQEFFDICCWKAREILLDVVFVL